MTDDNERGSRPTVTHPYGAPRVQGHIVGGGHPVLGKIFSAATIVPGGIGRASSPEEIAISMAFSPYASFGSRLHHAEWLDVACANVHPSASWSWLDGGIGVGHDAVRGTLTSLAAAFPREGGFILNGAIVQGARIALELAVEGTLEGPLVLRHRTVFPMPGRVRLGLCAVVRVVGGHVADVRHYQDPRGI